ncbi:MAG: 30S ribosome-binding factor RbfA [Acidobacteriota bacterium]
MSQIRSGARPQRVGDLVQREVARLMQFEVKDTRLGFMTVTEVRMSSDLRHARVYVSFLADGPARAEALRALHGLRGFVRKRLGQTLHLRYTPEITFTLDTAIEYGAHIEHLLAETRHTEDDG